jgi:hypothetical protein
MKLLVGTKEKETEKGGEARGQWLWLGANGEEWVFNCICRYSGEVR